MIRKGDNKFNNNTLLQEDYSVFKYLQVVNRFSLTNGRGVVNPILVYPPLQIPKICIDFLDA